MKNKIICIQKGGLGNQLFCYATAMRLALANNAELVVDNISGFARDHKYRRHYQLTHFKISSRMATPLERMMPFGYFQRFLLKRISRKKPFETRQYLEQENNDFDERLLSLKVDGKIYLEGYWQSEQYFFDIGNIIREEFEIIPPSDFKNQNLANQIKISNAVCIHIRWFDIPNTEIERDFSNNIDKDYYTKAISLIRAQTINPHFYIFSDHPDETIKLLPFLKGNATFVGHNKGDKNAYADLWLMTLCKHFIIANSTFSWWGAWLSSNPDKIVIAPRKEKNGEGSWGFKGLIPENWVLI